MNNEAILWSVARWLVCGATLLTCWYLAMSIWGWYRGESFGYSSKRMAIYWDRARFRHALAVLTLLVTAGVGALGWWLLAPGIPRVSFCAGIVLGYFFPLPGQLVALALKLYGIFPRHQSVPGFTGGRVAPGRSMRGPAGGRDP